MHILRLLVRTYFLVIITLLFVTCSSHRSKVYTIGFSQCIGDDLWRKQMINEMKIEASFHDNIRLIIEDAQGSSDLQIKQIQNLLNKKVDLLIISPNESQPITSIAEKAYLTGTPTILIDRKINSDKYSAFIGGDNYAIGKYAAVFLGNISRNDLKILEVWGLEGSSPAQERHKGFIDHIGNFPQLKIVRKISGKWLKSEAYKQALQIPDLEQFDVIFGHNEEMAKGVFEAFKARNLNVHNKVFLGVDALQGKEGGIQAVIDRKLTATLLYPTGGGQAIQVAKNILENKPYKKENILNTALVDSLNAPILQLQSVQINDYLEKIDTQLNKIKNLDYKYNNQQTLLYISIILMGLAFFLAILLFVAYNHSKRILSELKIKNEKIEQQRERLTVQREQLVEMNQKIEDVTSQKLRFFTNISHELRTPLSLIISPLERITEMSKNLDIKREIIVMRNNVERLQRLINQLLDFRKIEDQQMKLYVHEVNIVSLVKNIKSSFNYHAHIKEIEYNLEISCENIIIYCDLDKIEKVLLNLLSNAFKFTGKNGKVVVSVNENDEDVLISIKDTGKGIDKEHVQKVFERFYQGSSDSSSGTGIGLNLSKEYIDLHKGEIKISSEAGEGSTFTVILKKGTVHLNESYIIFDSVSESSHAIDNKYEAESTIQESVSDIQQKDYSLLLVEDDDNMRDYIKYRLERTYLIFTATNGKEAAELIKEKEISLIICDVMMPEMDGYEFCQLIKSNIAFSHIPIIMLTALASDQMLIKGLSFGADDYIYKPFNFKHLELKINNLLLLKQKMRESFKMEFLGSFTETELDNADKNFIKKVTSILDKYLMDNDISVEKISSEIGMSRIHLYRKVKEVSGSSPSEFFKIYKIKKSLPLLKAKNLSISEIAFRCGFSSPAYYSKCFREVLKVTPTDYQSIEN